MGLHNVMSSSQKMVILHCLRSPLSMTILVLILRRGAWRGGPAVRNKSKKIWVVSPSIEESKGPIVRFGDKDDVTSER